MSQPALSVIKLAVDTGKPNCAYGC